MLLLTIAMEYNECVVALSQTWLKVGLQLLERFSTRENALLCDLLFIMCTKIPFFCEK